MPEDTKADDNITILKTRQEYTDKEIGDLKGRVKAIEGQVLSEDTVFVIADKHLAARFHRQLVITRIGLALLIPLAAGLCYLFHNAVKDGENTLGNRIDTSQNFILSEIQDLKASLVSAKIDSKEQLKEIKDQVKELQRKIDEISEKTRIGEFHKEAGDAYVKTQSP